MAMTTPASSAWHRRRSARNGVLTGSVVSTPFSRGQALENTQNSGHSGHKIESPAPSSTILNRAPIVLSRLASRTPVSPSPTTARPVLRSHAQPCLPQEFVGSNSIADTRAHVLLAKAAQAGAILFVLFIISFPVLVLSFISCEWPRAALALPAPGLVAYVQTLVRLLSAAGVVASIIVFHAVTLANFHVAPRALPPQPNTFPAIFSSGPALRHLLSLALSGSVLVPSFAIVCHGFTISRMGESRVAPSWADLQVLFLTGAVSGVAYSLSWHACGGYVLRISSQRELWRRRVISDISSAIYPALAVFATASLAAGVLSLFLRVDGERMLDPAVAAAAVVEGAAFITGDFSSLRRFWICLESAALTILYWTLSSSVVGVFLTQPHNFVLASRGTHPSQHTGSGQFVYSGAPADGASADPSVLGSLIFALNARVYMPSADPTGILGVLALQDLCDNVSATPVARTPIFSDASGVVWHEILTACLNPIDKLSHRLWMRANSHKIRSELPSMFQVNYLESDALYQTHQQDYENTPQIDSRPRSRRLHFGVDEVSDLSLFGEAQKVLHALEALANLLVASRSEDQYGVAQRTLVDIMTCLLQCHEKVTGLNGSCLLQFESLLYSGGRSPGAGIPLEGGSLGAEAERIEKALVHTIRAIVDAFHTHLCGYLEAQEPRWAAKFNPRLAGFLKESP